MFYAVIFHSALENIRKVFARSQIRAYLFQPREKVMGQLGGFLLSAILPTLVGLVSFSEIQARYKLKSTNIKSERV